ncbi:MAG: hypothetical protein QNK37_14555 [Acidobacteriota bacterium]|nr:hypothetical protein [Acidobacteriota bacterium]
MAEHGVYWARYFAVADNGAMVVSNPNERPGAIRPTHIPNRHGFP